MRSPHITTDIAHGIATITLDRPERRNALNREMTESLTALLREHATRDDTRLFVLRGRGEAFCTGVDLDELSDFAAVEDTNGLIDLARARAALIRQLALQTPQPIIAVIEGPATGVGLAIALASDFLLATGHAKFGAPHGRLGLYPDAGLTFFLPGRVGAAVSSELLWTGRVLDTHDAVRVGLLSRGTAHHALERELRVLIGDLVDLPSSLRLELKRGLRADWESGLDAALRREQDSLLRVFDSDEYRRRLEARRRRTLSTARTA